jgi:hypothetical protein
MAIDREEESMFVVCSSPTRTHTHTHFSGFSSYLKTMNENVKKRAHSTLDQGLPDCSNGAAPQLKCRRTSSTWERMKPMYGVATEKGHRLQNQDAYLIAMTGGEEPFHMFGVLDGHGDKGRFASEVRA